MRSALSCSDRELNLIQWWEREELERKGGGGVTGLCICVTEREGVRESACSSQSFISWRVERKLQHKEKHKIKNKVLRSVSQLRLFLLITVYFCNQKNWAADISLCSFRSPWRYSHFSLLQQRTIFCPWKLRTFTSAKTVPAFETVHQKAQW